MKQYTAPKGNLERKITVFEAIKKYKHDKKIINKQIELAELEKDNRKKQFYEEKLKHMQNTLGKKIRRTCTKVAVLIAFPIVIIGSSIAAARHTHNSNVNTIVKNLEQEQNISLMDENGTIDYNETIVAMIKQKVADYYNISPSEIEISANYINSKIQDGSTSILGGEEFDISISQKNEDGEPLPICTYYSYKTESSIFKNEKKDTFPKGKASHKVLSFLKRIAKGDKTTSFDVTDLDNEELDNLPPSLPGESISLDDIER